MTGYTLRLILMLGVATAALSAVAMSAARSQSDASPEGDDRLVNDRCPVMTDEFASPTQEIQFEGTTVRFCCAECKDRFEADPVQYVSRLPQLPPETVQALIAGGHEQAKAARAARWVERWTQPLVFGAASLLAIWLLARIVRRQRQHRLDAPRRQPG